MQKQPSIWHDSVYHTTSRSQAAALSLIPLRLHDPKMACPIEGQKTGWCFASQEDDRVHVKPRGWVLSRLGGVKLLGHFENRGLLVLLLTPEGKDDPHPHVGAGKEGHRMTFAFVALTLVVIPGPRFRLRALSGKLMQRIAQGLDASVASMGFGILAAFTQHRRSPGHSLQTPEVLVARSVIPDFSQQPLRKPFSSTGKAAENTVVSVDQQMVFDDLLVLGNAFNDRQQLLEQVQHETCLRARGDCVGLQVRSVQLLINLGCHFGRVAVRSFSQGGLQVFDRGRYGTLRSEISLQKCQGRALLQRGRELQHHRVVDFEAGGQPFRQARLYLDQVILITGEPFQFGHQGTVRFQSPQIGELGSAIFGEQIGYDALGLGSRCRTPLIDRLGIDWIDRKAGLQQGGNQEVMICFDNTCHVCLTVLTAHGRQNLPQFDESYHGVSHLVGAEPTSRLSKDQDVVVG